MKTIICAAGIGTRLGLNVPKCMAQVAGKPIIQWQLEILQKFTQDITVVVGFQSDMVIDFIKKFNVKHVVNPLFATTSVVDSILLGIGNQQSEVLLVDGDVLFTSQGIQDILNVVGDVVCIKETISDDSPVFVEVEGKQIKRFYREKPGCFEWAGICKINSDYMDKSSKYIYQGLEKQLPLPCLLIDSVEIDTSKDLKDAEKWAIKRK